MADKRRRLATLRRLRRVNKSMRDLAAAALAQASSAVLEAEQTTASAESFRDQFDREFVGRVAQVSTPGHLDQIRAEYDARGERVSQAREQAERARDAREALRPPVAAAHRDLAVTDKLIARTREELAHALELAEQRTTDDLTATRKKPHNERYP